MDVDLHAQLPQAQQSDIVKLYRQILATYTNDNSSGINLNPFDYFRRMRSSYLVDGELKSLIRKTHAANAASKSSPSKARSVLALSLQDTEDLSPYILQQTADQLKSFLFAGHDTTSILLQWAFYELSRSPAALAALRAEHDALFGADSDPAVVTTILRERGDEVIAKMSYTSAVVKEILRLYPPAGTARRVPSGQGFFVTLPDGRSLCLDGLVLYNMHTAIQRDPKVYGSTAEVFVPERWLGDVDTSADGTIDDDEGVGSKKEGAEATAVPPSAWRPFERGPRNCIGQELANIEARVILALTVRRYDFEKVGAGRLKRGGDGGVVVDEVTGQLAVETLLFNVSVSRYPVSYAREGWAFHRRSSDADDVTDKAGDCQTVRWYHDEGPPQVIKGKCTGLLLFHSNIRLLHGTYQTSNKSTVIYDQIRVYRLLARFRSHYLSRIYSIWAMITLGINHLLRIK